MNPLDFFLPFSPKKQLNCDQIFTNLACGVIYKPHRKDNNGVSWYSFQPGEHQELFFKGLHQSLSTLSINSDQIRSEITESRAEFKSHLFNNLCISLAYFGGYDHCCKYLRIYKTLFVLQIIIIITIKHTFFSHFAQELYNSCCTEQEQDHGLNYAQRHNCSGQVLWLFLYLPGMVCSLSSRKPRGIPKTHISVNVLLK